MKRRLLIAGALLVAVLIGAGIGTISWVRASIEAPYRGFEEPVHVVIEPGMPAKRVARLLADGGVIERERALSAWLWWTDRTAAIHAGEYRFERPRSVAEIADIITQGRVLLRPVTVPEGSTRWQVAEAIAAAEFGSYEAALAATADPGLIADLDPEAVTLEGYLYPDTYMAPGSDGPAELVAAMVTVFRNQWTPEREARARELGLGLREVTILASLIEAETPSAAERPVVSAVFHNRLARGMLLQTDPTVLYAMKIDGRQDRRIRRSDLERDSPYNTYRYSGLPVGPIGNPRVESIDAALNPAEVDFLYFVSRNDGTHAFSRTLSEHNRNVNQYQRTP